MPEKLYLFKGNDGFYYIVSQISILVTELPDIEVGEQFEFLFPENAVKPKIRKGTIIMESGEINKFKYTNM